MINPNSQRPAPIRCRDEHGQPVVKVPLDRDGRRWAILDADDFDALPSGLRMTWHFNFSGSGHPSVRADEPSASGHLATVARIILRAGRGQQVAYRSPDRLDLRRSNIRLAKGGRAKRDDRGILESLAA